MYLTLMIHILPANMNESRLHLKRLNGSHQKVAFLKKKLSSSELL